MSAPGGSGGEGSRRNGRPGTPYFTIRVKCRNKHEFVLRKTHLDFDTLRARTARGRGRMPDFSPPFSWKNVWDPGARDEASRAQFEEWLRALMVRTHQRPKLKHSGDGWLEGGEHFAAG